MNILANLLQITIYSTLVWLVIVLFQALFGKKMSPLLRCALWLLLVARLCIPGVVPVEARLFTVPQSAAVQVKQTANALLDVPMFEESAKHPVTITSLPESGESAISQPEEPKAGWGLPFTVTFADLLLFLWGMGMGAVAVIQIAGALRIRERLRQATVLTAEYDGLVKRCKAKAGIRREIKIMVGYGLESPALTVSLCPKIILPYELLQEEDQEIEFALCHEMTHYKRGDHLIALVWCVLKCVYWFHPVVWVAQNQMRRDMETACDARVTKEMDKPTKKRYAEMILNLFSRDLENVGVAFCGLRDDAEKRIRGIFSIKKTKAAMKFVAMLVCVAMFALFFTTACQPAVEQVTEVATKMVESAPPIVSAAPQPSEPQYLEIDAPERVQRLMMVQNVDESMLDVDVDAAVVAPERLNSLPVYQLKIQEVKQEQIDKMLDYFMKGEVILDWDGNPIQEPKIKHLIYVTGGNDALLEKTTGGVRVFEKTPENRKMLEDAGLGDYLADHSEFSGFVEKQVNENGDVLKYGASLMVNSYDPLKTTENKYELRSMILNYGRTGLQEQFECMRILIPPSGKIEGNTITSTQTTEEAVQLAQKTVQDLGYEGFELQAVYHVEYADMSQANEQNPKAEQVGYEIELIKPLPNGMVSSINRIIVDVDEQGIRSLIVTNPADVTVMEEYAEAVPINAETLENVAVSLGDWTTRAKEQGNYFQNRIWKTPEELRQTGSAVISVAEPESMPTTTVEPTDSAQVVDRSELKQQSDHPIIQKIELEYATIRAKIGGAFEEIIIPVWEMYGLPGTPGLTVMSGIDYLVARVDAGTGAVFPMI